MNLLFASWYFVACGMEDDGRLLDVAGESSGMVEGMLLFTSWNRDFCGMDDDGLLLLLDGTGASSGMVDGILLFTSWNLETAESIDEDGRLLDGPDELWILELAMELVTLSSSSSSDSGALDLELKMLDIFELLLGMAEDGLFDMLGSVLSVF